jgi:hypothetical protein
MNIGFNLTGMVVDLEYIAVTLLYKFKIIDKCKIHGFNRRHGNNYAQHLSVHYLFFNWQNLLKMK